MEVIQNLARRIYNTYFNILGPMKASDLAVDARDIGMVARYNRPLNPFDGWGFFVMETINSEHKAPDAFKITEEGYTRFEVRVYTTIQQYFRERTGLVVPLETIYKMEKQARDFPDYYTRLAIACMNYEASHAPDQVPVNALERAMH